MEKDKSAPSTAWTDHPSCGHETSFTVTRLDPVMERVEIICEECFELVRDSDRVARLTPVIDDRCGLCLTSDNVRENADLGIPVCDSCRHQSDILMMEAERKHVPRSDVVPDVIDEHLFIGAKEAAYNRATLASLGITRVLICCDSLPAYHYPSDPSIRYHRLPLQDSLVQGLENYLPSALAFIARGAAMGEKCLVHCNAGVSRSGAVAMAYVLSKSPRLSVDEALAWLKTKRAIITPNTNFMSQLRAMALSPS